MKRSIIPAQAHKLSTLNIWCIPNKKDLFKQYNEKFLKEKGWVDLQIGFCTWQVLPKIRPT